MVGPRLRRNAMWFQGGRSGSERSADGSGDKESGPMAEDMAPRNRWHPSRLLDWYARGVVWLRWLVVAFWVAAAGASMVYLPALGTGGNDLEQLISVDNPAVQ